MGEVTNYFTLKGVVKYATTERASVSVEGLDYVVPVIIKDADKLIGKKVSIVGHISTNFDNITLVAEYANVEDECCKLW